MSDLQTQLDAARVDFERWFSNYSHFPRAIERNAEGNYVLAQAADAWSVWSDCADHYANRIAELERQLKERDDWAFDVCKKVSELERHNESLRSALNLLHDQCRDAKWPLLAEHMMPMNLARAALAIGEKQ